MPKFYLCPAHILSICSIFYASNVAYAQDITLVCKGNSRMAGESIGVSSGAEAETYAFKDGKWEGWLTAAWTDDDIKVGFPPNIRIGNFIQINRMIFINRISGTVLDIQDFEIGNTKAKRTFNGTCELAKRKF